MPGRKLPVTRTIAAWRAFVLSGFATSGLCAAAQQPRLPDYVPAQQVNAVIRVCGSPQMKDLLRLYEIGFQKVQPQVRFAEDLKSTMTSVEGVYDGRADVGLLGREIWPAEEREFAAAKRTPPTLIEVATGSNDVPKATFALMIFVPQVNPLRSVSMNQLRRIFGDGSGHEARTWGDLGLKGIWAARPIHPYGFSRDNDKALVFSKLVFHVQQEWISTLQEFGNQTGPAEADAGELIVRAVASDPDAIGISNVHYATDNVRALPISSNGRDPVIPSRASLANRTYPLSRAIYMVTNSPPNRAVIEFLHFVLSHQGASAVQQEGNYLPLTADLAARQRRMLSAK